MTPPNCLLRWPNLIPPYFHVMSIDPIAILENSSAATRPKHPFTDRVTLTSREHPNSTSSHTTLSGQFKALECVMCTQWKTPSRINRKSVLWVDLYLCDEKESWINSVFLLDPFTEGVESTKGNSVCLSSCLSTLFPSPNIFLLFLLRVFSSTGCS